VVSEAGGAPLEVAASTVDLTPDAGLPLGGYLLREGKVATDAHDPLEATLVWLRDRRGGEVLWVALDALAVDEQLSGLVAAALSRACGCATDAILVCASHTHSSAAGWVRGLGPMLPQTADDQLRTALVERLAAAAGELQDREYPENNRRDHRNRREFRIDEGAGNSPSDTRRPDRRTFARHTHGCVTRFVPDNSRLKSKYKESIRDPAHVNPRPQSNA
jgi:hypothetical protein